MKITDQVTIDDPLSMCDECTGIITETTHDGIHKVEFRDGTYGYFEEDYLVKPYRYKRDPMLMFRGAKPAKIVQDTPRQHLEADLHLKCCTWIKKHYPDDNFVRHEKERQRGYLNQNLMQKYNSIGGLCDFELIMACGGLFGLYIEFKKPGENWLLKDGKTVKPAYAHQYEFHKVAWQTKRAAYFCNDFEVFTKLYEAYRSGLPYPKQIYF